MKQLKSIEELDKQLIRIAITLLVLAVLWLAPTLLYYLVKRTLSLSFAEQATFSAEFVKGMFDRLDLAFFISIPVFCLSLFLLGLVLIENHKQRKQLQGREKKTEPSP